MRWYENPRLIATFGVSLMVVSVLFDLATFIGMGWRQSLLWFVVHSAILAWLLWLRDWPRRREAEHAQRRRQIQQENEEFERMIEQLTQQEIDRAMRRGS
jgi:membrane protein implicated in regulation of membrane protease activity